MSVPIIKLPFTLETALAKVKVAETAWNTSDPETVAFVYTTNLERRDRDEFFTGRHRINELLRRKSERELD